MGAGALYAPHGPSYLREAGSTPRTYPGRLVVHPVHTQGGVYTPLHTQGGVYTPLHTQGGWYTRVHTQGGWYTRLHT